MILKSQRVLILYDNLIPVVNKSNKKINSNQSIKRSPMARTKFENIIPIKKSKKSDVVAPL